MPRPQYDDYLGSFERPFQLYDIGPPEQIAFYSCFINDINDYRFNDHSALRKFKGLDLRLPLQLELAADREEFHAASARLESVPRPSLAPVIAACIGSGGVASVRDADVTTRRGALSRYIPLKPYDFFQILSRSCHVYSLGTGEERTFIVMYMNGKLHIDRKDFVSNLEVRHE